MYSLFVDPVFPTISILYEWPGIRGKCVLYFCTFSPWTYLNIFSLNVEINHYIHFFQLLGVSAILFCILFKGLYHMDMTLFNEVFVVSYHHIPQGQSCGTFSWIELWTCSWIFVVPLVPFYCLSNTFLRSQIWFLVCRKTILYSLPYC